MTQLSAQARLQPHIAEIEQDDRAGPRLKRYGRKPSARKLRGITLEWIYRISNVGGSYAVSVPPLDHIGKVLSLGRDTRLCLYLQTKQ